MNREHIINEIKELKQHIILIEDALILKILIKEKKLKCYENIMELYPEKPEIKNKQYSMLPYVIFSIMITTVILLIMCFAINDNYITTELDNPIQCIMSSFKNIVFNKLRASSSIDFIENYIFKS